MQGRFKMEYRLFTIVRYNYKDYNNPVSLLMAYQQVRGGEYPYHVIWHGWLEYIAQNLGPAHWRGNHFGPPHLEEEEQAVDGIGSSQILRRCTIGARCRFNRIGQFDSCH